MNKDDSKTNKRTIIYVVIIVIILLIAMVSCNIVNKYKTEKINDNLEIKYKKDLNLNFKNNEVKKDIVIKNNGSNNNYYALLLKKDMLGDAKGEIIINAVCKKGNCEDIKDLKVEITEDTEEIVIKNNIKLDVDDEHEYELTITYKPKEETKEDLNIEIKVEECKEDILKYENNGGKGCSSKVVIEKEKFGELCEPTKEGYIFTGWYTDKELKNKINSDSIITSSNKNKIYASWKANKYILTMINPGGSGNDTKEIIYDSEYGELPVPERNGYTFIGWYETELGGKEITGKEIHKVEKNVNIYSHWKANNYVVNYDSNKGSSCTSKQVTFSQKYGTLCTPSRKGYTFTGWFNQNGKQITKSTIVNISENHTLYAKWELDSYGLVYNNNGGSGCSTKNVLYGDKYGKLCEPVRGGYTFNGWFNTKNEIVNENTILDEDTNQTLIASWSANEYEVSYDSNGGSSCENKQLVYDEPYSVLCEPIKTGYTFNGWFSDSNYKNQIYPESLVKISSNHTLYAKWLVNEYTINFNQQLGLDGTTNINVKYDSLLPKITIPKREGYTFTGYYTEENGKGTKYYNENGSSSKKYNFAHNITLYAAWIVNEYTVTFDKQGGTSGTIDVTVTYDSSMPKVTPPTRVGYTFDGYYTEINGSGIKYYNNDGSSTKNWNIANDTLLYAKWIANEYTISFDMQGGVGDTTNVTATYDSSMPKVTPLTRVGYTFDGYYSETNGNGTKYYNSDGNSTTLWNIANDTTLYAKWVANKYTITLNQQSGTGGTSSVIATFGSAMPTMTKPTRTGYTFDGYYSETNGGGTKYYNSDESSASLWNIASDTTLYAKWVANKYTITLNSDGGTGGSTLVTATYNSSMPTMTKPSKTGYTFNGYYTEINGSGIKYYNADGSSATSWNIPNSTTTLYASWTANKYKITLNQQSGTGGTASVNATFGSAMPTMTKPTRSGYTFGGYYTETNGKGTKYYNTNGSSTTSWNIASDTTLYAKWIANKYTITFDRQGGTGGSNTIQVTYDQTLPSITVPTKDEYNFLGYYTEKDGKGTKYYNETGASSVKYTKTQGITLYAYYEEATITYDKLISNYSCANISNGTSPIFTYTGNCQVVDDGDANWKIKFLTSGTLTFSRKAEIDAFLVGGGGGGYSVEYSSGNDYIRGGGGGGGGYTKTIKNYQINNQNEAYEIVIGSGGGVKSAGGTTSAFSVSANGGTAALNGGSGGSGGGRAADNIYDVAGASYGKSSGGSGQGTTTCEFGEGTLSSCTRGSEFAYAGGGTGLVHNYRIYGKGGGHLAGSSGAYNGQANTGGGGGGPSGSGGSGIVIIRNKR